MDPSRFLGSKNTILHAYAKASSDAIPCWEANAVARGSEPPADAAVLALIHSSTVANLEFGGGIFGSKAWPMEGEATAATAATAAEAAEAEAEAAEDAAVEAEVEAAEWELAALDRERRKELAALDAEELSELTKLERECFSFLEQAMVTKRDAAKFQKGKRRLLKIASDAISAHEKASSEMPVGRELVGESRSTAGSAAAAATVAPQPHRNRTATAPQPHRNRDRDRTATAPQPHCNRTATATATAHLPLNNPPPMRSRGLPRALEALHVYGGL